jgi:hypothetical protein
MSVFDSAVATGLGLDFVDVDMTDPEAYRPYRPILLRQHPLKTELSLPAYLLVDDGDGRCSVRAEINGAMPQEQFRVLIATQMTPVAPAQPRIWESG